VVGTAARPGILLSLSGIATGLILSLLATRLLKSLIWGVKGTDPATFVVVALLLLAVATLASIVPALSLARIDPAQTLRSE
jgi:putative ABC transport system permease protein